MTTRRVNVVHVLVPRRLNGSVQLFFSPHARWRQPGSDRPLLALPSKKFSPRPSKTNPAPRLDGALQAILGEDLGLPDSSPQQRQRLGTVRTRLLSPTHQVATTYAIAPVLAPVPAVRHAALARRLRGEWLAPEQALREPSLSPTARLVLESCDAVAGWGSYSQEALFGSARDRRWTEQLLAARDGDVELFGPLFEEMKPLLAGRLRSGNWTSALGQTPDDIDDALQETVVRALEHLHTFDPSRGTALSWLWSITCHCGVSILRRRRVTVGLPFDEMADDGLSSPGADPADLAESREELAQARARLAAVLDAADPLTRRIWEMRYVAEMPYKTIAAELGMPVGTVATRIHRLRHNEAAGR